MAHAYRADIHVRFGIEWIILRVAKHLRPRFELRVNFQTDRVSVGFHNSNVSRKIGIYNFRKMTIVSKENLIMVTLHKLIPPENHDLFKRSPELNHIWEIPALQEQARECYEEWDTDIPPNETPGEIFSIDNEKTTAGVIGWFEYKKPPVDTLRLCYYGIVPSERGKKYGEKAMELFLQHLSFAAPKQYVYLSESVTLGRDKAQRIIGHFKSMGFVEFNDPNYGDNAECGPTQSLRVRIPGR
jgi:hypothetical protein